MVRANSKTGPDGKSHRRVGSAAERAEFDAALRMERFRLDKLLEIVDTIVLVLDGKGDVTFINPKGCHVLDLPAAQIIGRNWIETFVPENARERTRAVFGKLASGEEKTAEYVENAILTGNGEERIVAWHNSTIRNKEGGVLSILSSGEDITERKRSEEQSRVSEEKYRIVVENSPNPVYVINADNSIQYVNSALLDLTGFSKEELIGCKSPFPWWADEVRKQYQSDYEDPAITKTERQFKKKNGEIFWVALSAQPVVEHGNLQFHIVSWLDISDSMRAQKALKESEKHFRLLTKLSPVPVCIIQENGAIEYVNDRFTDAFGYTLEDIPTVESWYQRVYPDVVYRKQVKRQWAEAKERAERQNTPVEPQEFWAVCKDGSVCVVEVSSAKIGSKQLAVFNDVTAHRRLEDDLRKSVAYSQDLLANSPNPILTTNLDTSIRYVNPAFEKLTGFDSKELIGRKLPYPWWPEQYIPQYLQANDAGRTRDLTILERQYRKKSGELFWIALGIKPVRCDGEVDYYVSNWVDITERKKAEEEIEYQALLVNNVSDAIISTRTGSFISSWNRAAERIYGWKQEEVLGKRIQEVLHMEFPEGNMEDVLKRLDETGHWEGESVQKRRDGAVINVFGSVSRLSDSQGNLLGNVTIYRDITEHQRVVAALAQSEAKYRSLVETASAGVATIDLDGKITFVNHTLASMLGYSVEDLEGKNAAAVTYPEDWAVGPAILADARGGKLSGMDLEFRVIARDGRLIWFHTNPTPIEIGGQLAGFSVVLHDITQEVQSLKALKESESKFRSLAEQSPNTIFISTENRILYVNERCQDLTGYTREEVMSPDFDVMQVVGTAPSAIVDGSALSLRLGIERNEMGLRTKDGRLLDLIISSKSIDYQGEKAILGVITDVTSQKEAERQLRHAAQEWKITFDSIGDMVFIRDRENRITRMNRAFIEVFKNSPEEMLGLPCYSLVHAAKAPHPDCPYAKMVKTKKPASFEFYEPSLDMYLQESISPIVDEKGEIIGAVNVVRNVSEQKKIEEQFMMTDRLATLGQLAAGVAHELNNPLTGVIGFSQLLLEEDVSGKVKEELNIVASEAQRAAKIVKNLLTFARKHEPAKTLGQINDCILEVLNLRAYEHQSQSIRVVTKLDPELPQIMMDYFQMQQVFINIVINAEYFMVEAHGGGTLTITTERAGDFVKASVADDGPGIEPQNLKHLFNPFFTTKEVGKGTGLGLPICHGIVASHSGRIYVESIPGKGAAFTIELPIPPGNIGGPHAEAPAN